MVITFVLSYATDSLAESHAELLGVTVKSPTKVVSALSLVAAIALAGCSSGGGATDHAAGAGAGAGTGAPTATKAHWLEQTFSCKIDAIRNWGLAIGNEKGVVLGVQPVTLTIGGGRYKTQQVSKTGALRITEGAYKIQNGELSIANETWTEDGQDQLPSIDGYKLQATWAGIPADLPAFSNVNAVNADGSFSSIQFGLEATESGFVLTVGEDEKITCLAQG